MFSEKLIKLKSTVLTGNNLSDAVQKIYNPELSYYYNNNAQEDFDKAKTQLDKLLTSIYEETGKKYDLFEEYRKKIEALAFDKSAGASMSSLDFAKKTLESYYDYIIKNHKKIDKILVDSFDVTQCFAGAASNIRLAAEKFTDSSNIETILYATKVDCLRVIVSECVERNKWCPRLVSEIHYVNAYYNLMSSAYNVDMVIDGLAPTVISNEHHAILEAYIQKHLVNSFIPVIFQNT